MVSGLLSVITGVLGTLHFWDCQLDFITLGSTVLAAGLAIDFTAHICHAYNKASSASTIVLMHGGTNNCSTDSRIARTYNGNGENGTNNGARLAKLQLSLSLVGWPVLQAGIATWLGVLPLSFVPSYVVRVFVKTTFLVVLFGLLHGLIWLPQAMYSLDNNNNNGGKIGKVKMAKQGSENIGNGLGAIKM